MARKSMERTVLIFVKNYADLFFSFYPSNVHSPKIAKLYSGADFMLSRENTHGFSSRWKLRFERPYRRDLLLSQYLFTGSPTALASCTELLRGDREVAFTYCFLENPEYLRAIDVIAGDIILNSSSKEKNDGILPSAPSKLR